MRCHYISDLHLEKQEFLWELPEGDVLVVAGDLCQASCLSPARTDPFAIAQRDRVRRFAEHAADRYETVLAIAGNHEHYDGVFGETIALMREHLPEFTVLDNQGVELDGVSFFGTTLWSDFEARDPSEMERARRGIGEYFFVNRRTAENEESASLVRLRPLDTLREHERSLAALQKHLESRAGRPTVVISHHAPSKRGLNPLHAGNGLDGAYASDLDGWIATLAAVPYWVHGHTHIRRRYAIGSTRVVVNCRGFDQGDRRERKFSPDQFFEI